MEKSHRILNYVINLSFFLYFIILIAERTLSVVFSVVNNVKLYGNGYNAFTYSTIFASVLIWFIFLLIKCRPSIVALFRPKDEELINCLPFFELSIASGILLLSGMVHTEYTFSGIQFAAYGILIVGILLRAIIKQAESPNRLILWLSFAYLVAFSMAVPVMYPSVMESYKEFHALEAGTSYVLVGVFTFLLALFFKEEENLFIVWPVSVMVILDTILIIWRWKEEINYFVLIFASLSLILFVVGTIFSHIKPKEEE